MQDAEMERICVIADDLTGAAELAGVGFRYGFEAEVERVGGIGSCPVLSLPRHGFAIELEG